MWHKKSVVRFRSMRFTSDSTSCSPSSGGPGGSGASGSSRELENSEFVGFRVHRKVPLYVFLNFWLKYGLFWPNHYHHENRTAILHMGMHSNNQTVHSHIKILWKRILRDSRRDIVSGGTIPRTSEVIENLKSMTCYMDCNPCVRSSFLRTCIVINVWDNRCYAHAL